LRDGNSAGCEILIQPLVGPGVRPQARRPSNHGSSRASRSGLTLGRPKVLVTQRVAIRDDERRSAQLPATDDRHCLDQCPRRLAPSFGQYFRDIDLIVMDVLTVR